MRGLIFRLRETLGTVPAEEVSSLTARLTPAERRILGQRGIRLGTELVFVERLLKPAAIKLKVLLWTAMHGPPPASAPPPGRMSIPARNSERSFFAFLGYPVVAQRAIRADRLETLSTALRKRLGEDARTLDHALARLVGLPDADLPAVVAGLGYPVESQDGKHRFGPRQRVAAWQSTEKRGGRKDKIHRDGAFARLKDLSIPQ